MDAELRRRAEAARGFMPPDEGLALYEAAASVAVAGPLLEVGSYCGKSSVYLGAAAQSSDTVLVAIDHHRGSEENQPGWEWHEPDLVDPAVGEIDTLPFFRRTIHDAGLEGTVVAVVGESATVATASMPIWSPMSVTRSPRRTALSFRSVISMAVRSMEIRPTIVQRVPATMVSPPGRSSVALIERA